LLQLRQTDKRLAPWWGSRVRGHNPITSLWSPACAQSFEQKSRTPRYRRYFGSPAVSWRSWGFPPHPRGWLSIIVYRLFLDL